METALAAAAVAFLLALAVSQVFIVRLIRDLDATLSLDPNVPLSEVLGSLDLAARLAAKVARDLEINLAESRQQFSRLVILLDRMQMDVTATGESGVRMEAADAVVAADLHDLQEQARESEQGIAPGTIADTAAAGVPEPRKRARHSKPST